MAKDTGRGGLPRYAAGFSDLPLDEKQKFFKRIQVSDPINEKIFEFLCAAIADEVKHGKSARIELRKLLEKILRWSSNPNNFRTLPGFPRGEEVLKNRLNPFLVFLEEKGICSVDRVEEGSRLAVYLYLLPEGNVREVKQHKAYQECRQKLHDFYEHSASSIDIPFPDENDAAQWLLREPRLPTVTIQSKEFNRAFIERSQAEEAQLYKIFFEHDGSAIVASSDQLALLFQISVNRLQSYMHTMLNNQNLDVSKNTLTRVDFLLRDTHRAAHPDFQISVQRLYEQLTAGRAPFKEEPEIWCTLSHKLVSEVARSEKESGSRRTKMQTFALLFGYFSYEHDRKRQKEEGAKLLEALFKDISRFDRLFSMAEIRDRADVKQFVDTFSQEAFDTFFTRYLRNNLLDSGKVNVDDAFIKMESEDDAQFLLHVSNLLPAFNRDLSRASHSKHGMRKINFITYWSDLFYADMYVPDVAQMITDDKAFYGYLSMLVREQYPALFYIHEYLSHSYELLIYLCDKEEFPLRRYFNSDGSLKSIASLLNISRLGVLRRAKGGIPFWRKMYLKFLRLFRRGQKGFSLWKIAERELNKDAAQEHSQRERGRPFSEEARKEAVQKFSAAEELPADSGNAAQAESEAVAIDKKKANELTKEIGAGRSLDQYASSWNPKRGVDGQRFRAYVDRILQERINFSMEKINTATLDEETAFIISDPRLIDIIETDSLSHYTKLLILEKIAKQ